MINKLTLITAISLLFFSCKKEVIANSEGNQDLISVTKTQFEASKMEIATPIEESFDVTIQAAGTIDVQPQFRAKITPFLGGYVKNTTIKIGDKVVKGQTLVTLENTEYLDLQKEYSTVAEQITFLKSEYERQKTLFEEKISSQKNYLKAESDFRQAKGMYQSLKQKLQLLNINPSQVERGIFTSQITLKAPISGNVTLINANVGMFMAPSDIILELVDSNFLQLHLAVFEKDILHIKSNQKITFTIPEASDEVYQSSIEIIGKSIENQDRTISVYGSLAPEMRQKLLPGMFVEAKISTHSKKGLAVPIDAVFTENNKSYVLVQKKSKKEFEFQKIEVSLSNKNERFVEIIPSKDINYQTKILTKGVFELTE